MLLPQLGLGGLQSMEIQAQKAFPEERTFLGLFQNCEVKCLWSPGTPLGLPICLD